MSSSGEEDIEEEDIDDEFVDDDDVDERGKASPMGRYYY